MAESRLTSGDFTEADDPVALFHEWLEDATASEPNDPSATALATVDGDGLPDVRMVLLKTFDARGFVFYTNLESAKGRQISADRQGRDVLPLEVPSPAGAPARPHEEVGDREADAYFASRPRGSRIGAWASDQSRPLESRAILERRVRELEARYPGDEVPRPPHWSGFRIVPSAIEFWQDGRFRLHDRIMFFREKETDDWQKSCGFIPEGAGFRRRPPPGLTDINARPEFGWHRL